MPYGHTVNNPVPKHVGTVIIGAGEKVSIELSSKTTVPDVKAAVAQAAGMDAVNHHIRLVRLDGSLLPEQQTLTLAELGV